MRWFRPAVLRLVLESAMRHLGCAPFRPRVRIIDDPGYRPGKGQLLVLRHKAVEVHLYAEDPRDSSVRRVFASVDEFFATYLVERACELRAADVLLLPEVFDAGGRQPDNSLDPAAGAAKLSAWTGLVDHHKQLQKAYYQSEVQAFMLTWRYRTARRLLQR
jgi:hypothetical protein